MSMTEVNHCAENALAERMNGILKGEYALDQRFKTKAQTMKAVEEAIRLYGTRRPHSALGYRFPAQVHAECPPRPPCGMPGAWAPLRTMVAASSSSHARLPSALIPGADHSGVPLRGWKK